MTATVTIKGREVLAKTYKGGLTAVTYANRTQAAKKADELGWVVIRWGRPWLVAKS